MASVKATLKPSCLQWARERAGFNTSDIARKIGVKEDKVIQWEQSGEISLSHAEKLASVTHTPIGYLFLPVPPIEKLPVSDFRTVQTQDIARPSPDLLDIVNDALRRQDWYRDYLISSGGEPLPFVKSLTLSSNIISSADLIRATVNWNSDLRTNASTWEIALSKQIDAIEETGVLVMRSGVVGNNGHRPLSVSEFRGFALSDSYAPLVFINGKDSKAAQIFTLAHELVHIWLGISGVSNLNQTYSPEIDTERFCNAVAAELLVPLAEIRTQWDKTQVPSEQVVRFVQYFKVSSLVILRRLRDADYLSADEFNRLYTDELVQFSQRPSATGGGNFYLTLRTRLGKRFTSALVESTLEGATLYRDAFHLLGVNNSVVVRRLAELGGAVS
jgi:Zn-dependent peptidase ImmA (M78 family)